MSIRFLKRDKTIGMAPSIEALFDPRINDNFTYDTNGNRNIERFLNWQDAVDLLNTLYCKENIENYSFFQAFLFGDAYPTLDEWEIFKDVSADVAPEHRFLFAFMTRKGRLNHPDSRFLLPDGIQVINACREYIAYDHSLGRYPVTQTREEFAQGMETAYEIYKTRLFNSCLPDTKWMSGYMPIYNTPLGKLLQFSQNQTFFSSYSGSMSPAAVAQALADNNKTEIKITFDPAARSVRLKVIVKVGKNFREPLYNILSYSTNALELLPYPNMEKKEKNPVLVGVELEVSTDYNVNELIDAADEPFFLAKQDSSISGNKRNAMELVTAPSSFKYLKRQYALWFNKLDYTRFDVTTDTNNGMHVHVGRDHFEDNAHIRNFCWFFNNPANTEFLLFISERSRDSLNRWSPVYNFSPGTTKTKAFRDIYYILGSGFRGITHFKGGWDNGTTIEVRMFKGVVSYAAIVKNLDFVEAVFNFTKGLSSYRQMSLSSFLDWLKQQPQNKYILLRKFLEQGKLKKMLVHAQVKDLIFNERDAEKIGNLLRKAPFKLTQEHISILNKGRQRTFTLDRITGEVNVIHPNRSKLHTLDKSFAERYLRNEKVV